MVGPNTLARLVLGILHGLLSATLKKRRSMSEKNTRNQWCKLETSALSHIFVRTAEEDNRTTQRTINFSQLFHNFLKFKFLLTYLDSA